MGHALRARPASATGAAAWDDIGPDSWDRTLWDLDRDALLAGGLDTLRTDLVDVPRGPMNLGLDLDGDGAVDATFAVPDLGPDPFVNVFVTDDDAGLALTAVFDDGEVVRVGAD